MKPTPQPTGSLRAVLGNLYAQAYADSAVGVSRTDDLYQALAQLEELIEKRIIGEDELPESDRRPQQFEHTNYERNHLHREQRISLKALIKEKVE